MQFLGFANSINVKSNLDLVLQIIVFSNPNTSPSDQSQWLVLLKNIYNRYLDERFEIFNRSYIL